MKITVDRFTSDEDSTVSLISIDGQFECFGLEDEYREEKIASETRIPAGIYEIARRNWGGFHARYNKRFPLFHVGMLQVMDVPGFTSILIHIGNTDDDTAGCLIVGKTSCVFHSNMSLGHSRDAYISFYKKVVDRLGTGEKVTIEYVDNDR